MTSLRKIAIVAGVQFLLLFGVIGWNQYTVWTGETVVLKATPYDPRDPFRGDFLHVQYEISTLDAGALAGDDGVGGAAYVELRRGDDGYWHAVAIHSRRTRSFDGTVLLKGDFRQTYGFGGQAPRYHVDYDIEDLFVAEGDGRDLPPSFGVEVKVDRYGRAVPRHLVLDGAKIDASR
jgi:uncharacterized membrane-anchored protein